MLIILDLTVSYILWLSSPVQVAEVQRSYRCPEVLLDWPLISCLHFPAARITEERNQQSEKSLLFFEKAFSPIYVQSRRTGRAWRWNVSRRDVPQCLPAKWKQRRKQACKSFQSHSFSKVSRRIHPSFPSCSWSWASCCDYRRPPRHRCLQSGRRHHPPTLKPRPPCRKSASEWVIAPRLCSPQCRPRAPWRTGRSQTRCRSTGGRERCWSESGSFGSGCLGMVEAGRCGTGWRRARRLRSGHRCRRWRGWLSR